MKKIVFILYSLLIVSFTDAQTLGLTFYTEDISDGYLLFSTPTQKVYLIDNCGEKINEWTCTTNSQFTAYLLPNGDLLKMGKFENSAFLGGGSSGLLEIYSWEGELKWSTIYSNDEHHMHHNVETLPNGNILLIAWEKISAQEVLDAGRESVNANGLWSEKIVEIKALGTDSYEEVWVWRAWDHIVQDKDPLLNTYGLIEDNPNLIDLNFGTPNDGDWLHFNYIDFNESLDQILISSRSLSEVLIIDHSTSTLEASGSTGGLSGKGGDLLYRWGNPQNYNQGFGDDQKLFGQHGANWIEDERPGGGNILIFNNGAGVPEGQFYSSVVELITPLNEFNYELENGAFLPNSFFWEYKANPPQEFYSSRTSSCQRQENGNTLINEGATGRYFEVDNDSQKVWEYINPHGQQGIFEQGESPTSNGTFIIQKYPYDYSAFDDKNLSPLGPIELNPTSNICLSNTLETESENLIYSLENPSNGFLIAHRQMGFELSFVLMSVEGKKIMIGSISKGQKIDISHLQSGLYFVLLNNNIHKLILE